DYQPCTGASQLACQVISNMAAPLNCHDFSGKVVASPATVGCSLHSTENAPRGLGGRITRPPLQSGNVSGFLPDVFHVRGTGADILAGNVLAAKALHQASVGAKQLLANTGAILLASLSQND